jgi:hypothetical protein
LINILNNYLDIADLIITWSQCTSLEVYRQSDVVVGRNGDSRLDTIKIDDPTKMYFIPDFIHIIWKSSSLFKNRCIS